MADTVAKQQQPSVDSLVRKLSYHRVVVEKLLGHHFSHGKFRFSGLTILERKLIQLEEMVLQIPDDGDTQNWDLFVNWRDAMTELWARYFIVLDGGRLPVASTNGNLDASSTMATVGTTSAGNSSPNAAETPSASSSMPLVAASSKRLSNGKSKRSSGSSSRKSTRKESAQPAEETEQLQQPLVGTHSSKSRPPRQFRSKNFHRGSPSKTTPVNVTIIDEGDHDEHDDEEEEQHTPKEALRDELIGQFMGLSAVELADQEEISSLSTLLDNCIKLLAPYAEDDSFLKEIFDCAYSKMPEEVIKRFLESTPIEGAELPPVISLELLKQSLMDERAAYNAKLNEKEDSKEAKDDEQVCNGTEDDTTVVGEVVEQQAPTVSPSAKVSKKSSSHHGEKHRGTKPASWRKKSVATANEAVRN